MYKAAFQADTNESFRELLAKASELYKGSKAHCACSRRAEDGPVARRRDAMVAYIGCWTVGSMEEKRCLVGAAWEHTRASLLRFQELGKGVEFRRTFRDLADTAALVIVYEWDYEDRKRVAKEGR